MMETIAANFQKSPDTFTNWGTLMLHSVYPYYEVAVVGPDAGNEFSQLAGAYLPNTIIVSSDKPSDMPLFKNRYVEGETYIYVCQNHSCKLPVTTARAAMEQITY